jgi:predicted ArsR family transcriptional regulator
VAISLPARHPDLVARFLVRAIVGAPAGVGAQKAREAAHDFGHGLGLLARNRAGKRAGRTRLREEAVAVLREKGFEPVADRRGNMTLRNCPFDPLAAEFPGTICDLNLALHQGLLEGLGRSGLRVELAPAPGRCCVTFHSGR